MAPCDCSRPSPAGMAASQLYASAAEHQQQQHYDRRQLLLNSAAMQRDAGAEAAPLAAGADGPTDTAAAQHIGLMCSFQIEQLLADMSAAGLRLAPQQQQEAAVAALSADVEQLAAQLVRSTAATIAALRAKLQSSIPRAASPADVAALLHNSLFQEQLKDARDDAQLAITAALQPHLPSLVQSVHAVLGALVQAPGSMQPLASFEEAFAPSFTHAFTSSAVEATLLQALWRD
ncbi:hypothetical protein ABPG77_006235 [Micractinium sp. CCAP 211/92]